MSFRVVHMAGKTNGHEASRLSWPKITEKPPAWKIFERTFAVVNLKISRIPTTGNREIWYIYTSVIKKNNSNDTVIIILQYCQRWSKGIDLCCAESGWVFSTKISKNGVRKRKGSWHLETQRTAQQPSTSTYKLVIKQLWFLYWIQVENQTKNAASLACSQQHVGKTWAEPELSKFWLIFCLIPPNPCRKHFENHRHNSRSLLTRDMPLRKKQDDQRNPPECGNQFHPSTNATQPSSQDMRKAFFTNQANETLLAF